MKAELILRSEGIEVSIDIPISSLKDQLEGRHKDYMLGIDLHAEVVYNLTTEIENEFRKLAERVKSSYEPEKAAIRVLCATLVMQLDKKYNHGKLDGDCKIR